MTRLRPWAPVVISVLLLVAGGAISFLLNRSAVRAADSVHRADSLALGRNNGILTGQLQLLSAAELNDFVTNHPLSLVPGSAQTRKSLTAMTSRSSSFGYGAVITDLNGAVLNATRISGVPALNDPGWEPMRRLLVAGQPGFSSIMTVGKVHLTAVAIPIMVGGKPAGVLIGLNDVAKTDLQKYTSMLSTQGHVTAIVDSAGVVAATSDPTLLGTHISPAVQAAVQADTHGGFVDYTSGDESMIGVTVGGLPGGWAYVRTQTRSSFDGAVHTRSQTLNATLLAMMLIGSAAISILGHRTAVQRRRADARFHALFRHAPDSVSVIDAVGTIAYTSPSSEHVLGLQPGDLVGTNVFDLVHPEEQAAMRQEFADLLGEREAVRRLVCRVRERTGGFRWFEFTASNQLQNEALNGVVINARDVSETRAFQERLAYEAQHDPLTGLPNRRRMRDDLDIAMSKEPVAVLFVDLNGFKPVNDTYGHDAGDELLRQVAGRLSACVRAHDVLARIGGDEFVVLMPGVQTDYEAHVTHARIEQALSAPFLIDRQEITIGASIGVHLAPAAADPDEVLRAADHAMYVVKKSGGDGAGRQPAASTHVGRHRAPSDE